jgi:hypothetical protein
MLKVMTLIWVILGTTLAGILVLVVLTVPSLLDQAMRFIPLAAAVGYVAGVPFSYLIARRLMANRRPVTA